MVGPFDCHVARQERQQWKGFLLPGLRLSWMSSRWLVDSNCGGRFRCFAGAIARSSSEVLAAIDATSAPERMPKNPFGTGAMNAPADDASPASLMRVPPPRCQRLLAGVADEVRLLRCRRLTGVANAGAGAGGPCRIASAAITSAVAALAIIAVQMRRIRSADARRITCGKAQVPGVVYTAPPIYRRSTRIQT